MPSFADAWDSASDVVRDTFADKLAMRFMPMATSDTTGRPGPDASRAIVDALAVYDDSFARAAYGAGVSKDQPELGAHATKRAVINLQAASLPWRPRNDDRILRVKTGLTYRIAEVREEGDGWLALDVNLLTRP